MLSKILTDEGSAANHSAMSMKSAFRTRTRGVSSKGEHKGAHPTSRNWCFLDQKAFSLKSTSIKRRSNRCAPKFAPGRRTQKDGLGVGDGSRIGGTLSRDWSVVVKIRPFWGTL